MLPASSGPSSAWLSSASALASSSVWDTPTRFLKARNLMEWQAAHTCLYTWYPRRIEAWSKESMGPL